MKKLILIFLLIPVLGFTQNSQIVWDELTKDAKCELRMLADSSYVMDDMPFHVKFNKDNVFRYEQDGKHIELTPVGMEWSSSVSTTVSKKVKGVKKVKTEGGTDGIKYKDLFNPGISLDNDISKKGWRKIITIDNLAALGTIPVDAEYLEFIFEIKTDFDVKNGGVLWDKNTDITFTDNLELTKLSRMRPINVWNADTLLKCTGSIINSGGKKYLIKSIPVSFLKSENYPIQTDVTIIFGSEYVFNTNNPEKIDVVSLSSTSFVVVYRTTAASYWGRAKVGTISGTTISYGSEYTFASKNVGLTAITKLSSTSFFIAFYNVTDQIGQAIVGTVSGTTISFGTAVTYYNTFVDEVICSALSSTSVVITFYDYANNINYTLIASVSGTSISYGSNYNTSSTSGITDQLSVKVLSSSKFVVAFRDNSTTSGVVRVATVSGTSITFGTQVTFNSGNSIYMNLCSLSDSKFILFWRDISSSTGKSIIGTVSGTTISLGSPQQFLAASANTPRSVLVSTDKVILSYTKLDAKGYARIVTISGTTATFDTEDYFNNASTQDFNISGLDNLSFIIAFKDIGNSSYGTAIIGTIPADGKKINGVTYVKWNGSTITKWNGQ